MNFRCLWCLRPTAESPDDLARAGPRATLCWCALEQSCRQIGIVSCYALLLCSALPNCAFLTHLLRCALPLREAQSLLEISCQIIISHRNVPAVDWTPLLGLPLRANSSTLSSSWHYVSVHNCKLRADIKFYHIRPSKFHVCSCRRTGCPRRSAGPPERLLHHPRLQEPHLPRPLPHSHLRDTIGNLTVW